MVDLLTKLRSTILALAVVFGAYVALLCALAARLFSDSSEVRAGVVLVTAIFFLSRRALGRAGPNNHVRMMFAICRDMPALARMFGALGLVAVAITFDRYFDGDPTHFRTATFLIPIMVSVALFDLRPGIVAVGASALAVDYFLLPPFDSFGLESWGDALKLAAFIVASGAIALLLDRAIGPREPSLAPRRLRGSALWRR